MARNTLNELTMACSLVDSDLDLTLFPGKWRSNSDGGVCWTIDFERERPVTKHLPWYTNKTQWRSYSFLLNWPFTKVTRALVGVPRGQTFWKMLFTSQVLFLLRNQQCQSTERNSKH